MLGKRKAGCSLKLHKTRVTHSMWVKRVKKAKKLLCKTLANAKHHSFACILVKFKLVHSYTCIPTTVENYCIYKVHLMLLV